MVSARPSANTYDGLLDPDSYTAHRLHHATPPHLHLTSRRVFVGPIPVGWLKAHSRHWYKQHSHYSKRASTFTAATNTVPTRTVTGLEGRAPARDGVSSPIPIPTRGLPDPSTGVSSQSSAAPERQQRPKTSDTTTSLATARTRPGTGGSVFNGVVRPAPQGESYSTANEAWEHANQFPQGKKNDGPNVKVTHVCHVYGSEPMAAEHSQTGVSTTTSAASHTLHAHDSLASLLQKDEERWSRAVSLNDMNLDGQGGSRMKKKRSDTIDSLEEITPAPYTFTRTSTNQDRVASGLVRFNTDEVSRRDSNAEVIQGLDRARSLRRAGRRRSSLRRRSGEILKMGSMLVRIEVAQAQRLPDDYDENESLKVNTKTMDKWREYMVVCRESDDPEIPMILRLYKSRTIAQLDKKHFSHRSPLDIPIKPKSTRANLYSTLDKSLVVWLPHRRGTLVYIMKPRCASSAVEWYTFLRTALGDAPSKSLLIAVPDLGLTISLNDPFERTDRAEKDQDGNITEISQDAVAANLLRRSMSMLEGVDEWASILEHWKNNERMGLAWRRYDRLEWVHGPYEQRMDGSLAMQKTHELELRPKTHYPTECKLPSGEKMIEPPPVEGFLIRLTSGKGRESMLGKNFRKRFYFATHDQFLFFSKPGQAQPPPPPSLRMRTGVIPTIGDIADGIPIIYSVAPYALDANGDIEWLANPTPSIVERKDQEAYMEAERKVNFMSKAEGFVDLTTAERVQRVGQYEDVQTDGCLDGPSEQSSSNRDVEDCLCFEIFLENGLILKLQAFDRQTCDEWILRLGDLITYWKARHRTDLSVVRQTQQTNLKQLCMDEEMESIMGQFGRKWEVSRTLASSELYNVCGVSTCRTVAMSGVLYRKPRRHSTFHRYHVILFNGELAIFHHSARSKTGEEIPTVYQEKHLSLSLKDCYIYSGLVTQQDMVRPVKSYSNVPGRHALPRIYPDGYTCQDEDAMTYFVLWHGLKRNVFLKRDSDGNTVRKWVPPLGTTGRSIVFKARSRVERDTWVMNIAREIERLNLGIQEDVNVVPEN